MKQYELSLVLRPDLDGSDTKKLESIVQTFIDASRARVESLTVIGKKQLAYPIKKNTEGLYVTVKVGANNKIGELDAQMKLNKNVLRYLLLKA